MGALLPLRHIPCRSRHQLATYRLHGKRMRAHRCSTARKATVVKAFKEDDDGVMLPMDAYRVRHPLLIEVTL